MLSRFSALAMRLARVAPQPEPPVGAPGSARTFRAGRNYYLIRLLRWGAAQIGAAAGLAFSIGFTTVMTQGFDRAAVRPLAAAASATPSPAPTPSVAAPRAAATATPTPEGETAAISAAASPSPTASRSRRNRDRLTGAEFVRRITTRMPPWVVSFVISWFVPFLLFLEVLGIVTFLIQLLLTYFLVRIEFEQHWYIVTDRSLRIRTGVLSLTESTMSFANLQQVEVKQGPLQRLLGVADVRVRSAGGGSGSDEGEGAGLHEGVFHSVENAEEIRDLIIARLRAFREEGLGDPDRAPNSPRVAASTISAETLEAAREVLLQCRELRIATLKG